MSDLALRGIEAMFFTPLARFEVTEPDELNRLLLEEIAAMRTGSPGVTRSNQKGWHSVSDFFVRTEPGCRAVAGYILGAVKETTRRLSPKFDFASHVTQAEGWINVNPHNALNAPHEHGGSMLSGTYYVSVPAEARDRSGALQFRDPRINAGALLIEGAACFKRSVTLLPKAGQLVIFPSYVTHWVLPNDEERERVSIAFNIRYVKRSDKPAAEPGTATLGSDELDLRPSAEADAEDDGITLR